MKNEVFLLSLVMMFSVSTMELPQEHKIKREEVAEEIHSAKEQKVGTTNVFDLLPPELRQEILLYLTQGRGPTQHARLYNAAQNIRNLLLKQ